MESVRPLSCVGTGMLCETDGICVEFKRGWDMDAMWEWVECVWPLTWLVHGCFVGTEGVCVDANMFNMVGWERMECVCVYVDVNMVWKWMLCGNQWSLRRY